jgi:hypothetical protein
MQHASWYYLTSQIPALDGHDGTACAGWAAKRLRGDGREVAAIAVTTAEPQYYYWYCMSLGKGSKRFGLCRERLLWYLHISLSEKRHVRAWLVLRPGESRGVVTSRPTHRLLLPSAELSLPRPFYPEVLLRTGLIR